VPTVTVKLQPEYIRSFVSSYEEKRKIMSELDSLENMVQKGRVPRRRYKVRRKTLETRLSTLSKGLEESKDKLRSAGGKYADLMRQLEVAETEINEGEANIKSIEARHSRGEISLETYRKLLGDYQHRKETANTTVSGILLRLREELR
jgi:chromosome segregation ATPase